MQNSIDAISFIGKKNGRLWHTCMLSVKNTKRIWLEKLEMT